MLRGALVALAFVLLPASAHAQDGRVDSSETPIVRATANVILQSLAETQYREWGYRWDAVSIRVSRYVHWHIYEPDARDRAPETIVRRNGWVDEPGAQVGVSVFGNDEAVTALSFTYDAFTNRDLIDALGDAGAEVSFQADYETYSEYLVSRPGRETAKLTVQRLCTPDNMASARRCQNGAEVSFDIPG